MVKWKEYTLLAAGFIILIAAAFTLAEANERQSRCESLTGKVVQMFHKETSRDCGQVKTLHFLSYTGIALGIALMIINFVKRKGPGF